MTPIITTRAIIPPAHSYLRQVRELCSQYGVLLILDEVHTGFRVHPQGAQGLFGIAADITVLGKALASGFPVSAVGGRETIMGLIGDRRVDHSGTFNSNVACMAAAKATLASLTDSASDPYRVLEERGTRLIDGIRALAQERGVNLLVQGYPALFSLTFTPLKSIRSYRDCFQNDGPRYRHLVAELMDRGVRPTERGVWYLSAAHSAADIDHTLAAMAEVLQ